VGNSRAKISVIEIANQSGERNRRPFRWLASVPRWRDHANAEGLRGTWHILDLRETTVAVMLFTMFFDLHGGSISSSQANTLAASETIACL